MRVLLSRIEIHISHATSLKDKRRVIKGLKDKIWSRFRASISEVDGHESPKVAILGLSYVSNDSTLLESIMNKVVNLIEDSYPGYLYHYEYHVEHY
jgi:uncharacterized protein YlxP (DUF503 family)